MSKHPTRMIRNRYIEASSWANFASILFGLTIIGLPISFLVVTRSREKCASKLVKEMEAAGKEALCRFAEKELLYVDANIAKMPGSTAMVNASGLGTDGQDLYVLQQGVASMVPFAKVRRWWWEIKGHTVYSTDGGDVSHAIGDYRRTMQSAAQAYLGSGFFLEVADVDRPVVQIQSADEGMLRRWYEIMTQISEGRLKSRADVAAPV